MDWFFDTPETDAQRLVPFRIQWLCPQCKLGYMVYTGSYWPTGDPGYHHKCSSCGHCAAIHKHRYPYINYRQPEEVDGE